MSRVYDRLHSKGKLVTAVVAAKTRDMSTGWAAAYDYSALYKVVDYVMVMAYDYSYAKRQSRPHRAHEQAARHGYLYALQDPRPAGHLGHGRVWLRLA